MKVWTLSPAISRIYAARTLVAGAMRALRAPVLVMGLMLFICTTVQSYPSINNGEKDEKTWFRRIMDIMSKVENSVGDGSAHSTLKDHHNLKTKTGETILGT